MLLNGVGEEISDPLSLKRHSSKPDRPTSFLVDFYERSNIFYKKKIIPLGASPHSFGCNKQFREPLQKRLHGWSFFGKVGGAKIILADGFCANTTKISRFIVEQS